MNGKMSQAPQRQKSTLCPSTEVTRPPLCPYAWKLLAASWALGKTWLEMALTGSDTEPVQSLMAPGYSSAAMTDMQENTDRGGISL